VPRLSLGNGRPFVLDFGWIIPVVAEQAKLVHQGSCISGENIER
jgi:hypothetical protein